MTYRVTDLKPDNIMVRLENKSILEEDARAEFNNLTSITDLGLSVMGAGPHHGCIQAEPYRAPEVILDCGLDV